MSNFAYSSAVNNLVGGTAGANVSQLVQCLNDLKTFLNSPNLDSTNLADVPETLLALALQQKLGLNDGSQIGRGKSIIATEEARTNTAYGTHTTPDQVSSVVLPTDGLLFVGFQAMWKESVAGAGRAAIFLGSNQLKYQDNGGASPVVQEAVTSSGATDVYKPLVSSPSGLVGIAGSATPYTGDVTTGQLLGVYNATTTYAGFGFCTVFAAAGTYTVSVQTKSSSGSVTMKNRKLWVWSAGF